jgi:hypothetical protein
MRTNLIITTYSGYYSSVNKKNYLKNILTLLNRIKTNVTQITIMKPKVDPGHNVHVDYYNFDTIDISNISSRIKIFECENIGISYGQFLTGISLNTEFDYSIFIEDDYLIFMDYFEEYLVSEYNKNEENSFLCLFYFKSRKYNLLESITNNELQAITDEFLQKTQTYGYILDSQFTVPDFSIGILSKKSYETIIGTFGCIQNINDILSVKFRHLWIYQVFFGYILSVSNLKVNQLADKNLNFFYHTPNDTVSMCNFDMDILNWKERPYNNEKFDIPVFIPIEFLHPYDQCESIPHLLKYLKEPHNFLERYHFLNNVLQKFGNSKNCF